MKDEKLMIEHPPQCAKCAGSLEGTRCQHQHALREVSLTFLASASWHPPPEGSHSRKLASWLTKNMPRCPDPKQTSKADVVPAIICPKPWSAREQSHKLSQLQILEHGAGKSSQAKSSQVKARPKTIRNLQSLYINTTSAASPWLGA